MSTSKRARGRALEVALGLVLCLGRACIDTTPPPNRDPPDYPALHRRWKAECTPARSPEALIRCMHEIGT